MSNQNQETQENAVVLDIQRIYVKDVSFEAPNSPEIFRQEWKPELSFDLNTESKKIADDLYEVCLNISVESTMLESKDTVFICEVKQAGIFLIKGLNEAQMAHCLNSHCPNILYPYARELISNMVARGTFPALNLNPINFDALFMEYLQKSQEAQETSESDTKH